MQQEHSQKNQAKRIHTDTHEEVEDSHTQRSARAREMAQQLKRFFSSSKVSVPMLFKLIHILSAHSVTEKYKKKPNRNYKGHINAHTCTDFSTMHCNDDPFNVYIVVVVVVRLSVIVFVDC